jgi:hypothetical protein
MPGSYRKAGLPTRPSSLQSLDPPEYPDARSTRTDPLPQSQGGWHPAALHRLQGGPLPAALWPASRKSAHTPSPQQAATASACVSDQSNQQLHRSCCNHRPRPADESNLAPTQNPDAQKLQAPGITTGGLFDFRYASSSPRLSRPCDPRRHQSLPAGYAAAYSRRGCTPSSNSPHHQ